MNIRGKSRWSAERKLFWAGAVGLAVSLLLVLLPPAPVAGAQAASGGEIILASLADDTAYQFRAPEWSVTAELVDDTIFVNFTPTDGAFAPSSLAFTAPGGFDPPQSYFNGEGTIQAYDDSEDGCQSDGPFEVNELSVDESGVVTALAIDYFERCQGVRGSIRINSDWPIDEQTGFGGYVTDELTGEPLEGIWVCPVSADSPDCAVTDADGFYAVMDIPQDIYVILFFDPEGLYATECFRETTPCSNDLTRLDKREFINVDVGINATLVPGCLNSPPTIEGTELSETINGTPGDDFIMGYGGDDIINGNGGDDIICGGTGNDRITTSDGKDAVLGGPGDDIIVTAGGDDLLFGGSGRDRIRGGADDDEIYGGNDIDYLWGDNGNDQLYGERGSDRMRGGLGNDQLWGDSGADRMWGGDGADELRGMGGQDQMWGGPGNDTMQGNHQSDEMWGGTGDDDIRAAKGKDRLWGGAGADVLFGGDNSDQMTGGDGIDQLNGGRGSDVCAPDAADTRQSCNVGIF